MRDIAFLSLYFFHIAERGVHDEKDAREHRTQLLCQSVAVAAGR